VLPIAPFFDPGVDFGVFEPKIRVFRAIVLILRSYLFLILELCFFRNMILKKKMALNVIEKHGFVGIWIDLPLGCLDLQREV